MLLIDVERLKKEIEETVKKEVCLSQGELERIMMIIDEQPTVVLSADEMWERLQKRIEHINKEIRKWGEKR